MKENRKIDWADYQVSTWFCCSRWMGSEADDSRFLPSQQALSSKIQVPVISWGQQRKQFNPRFIQFVFQTLIQFNQNLFPVWVNRRHFCWSCANFIEMPELGTTAPPPEITISDSGPKHSLIVVSNRLPFVLKRNPITLELERKAR